MGIFTKAFWKDAGERLGSTAIQVIGGAIIALGLSASQDLSRLGDWSFWQPLLWAIIIALVKVLMAGAISPNTGASLGTTVPGEIVSAYTTQTTIKVDGDKIGMGVPDEVLAHPGDTVAGPAAPVTDGRPVDVTQVGDSPYTPNPDSRPPQ